MKAIKQVLIELFLNACFILWALHNRGIEKRGIHFGYYYSTNFKENIGKVLQEVVHSNSEIEITRDSKMD